MKRTEQDNTHCFRHACTHKRDLECPYCERERFARDLFMENWPGIGHRVKHPDLWRELDKFK
jgi:hypothetical protein